ncbi:sulfurtransferase complex subunit TusD [Aliikangiella maris]|uniref:Sulfurtransferase complex subunit TusD n=2 Tax=Aliikangiella maris TaxID=3162458 RepID=A0ABV3MUH3_9GAMM
MSSTFTLLISGSPSGTQAHLSALRFARCALAQNHQISNIFFYQDAVAVANRFNVTPSDENNLAQSWLNLSKQYQIELQVCIAAANRRGIISDEEAKQNHIDSHSLQAGFHLLGLGQLAASLSQPQNKLIHFK